MIRANFRKNSNENGHSYVRIQFYTPKGTYMTNEMIRVKYALDGGIFIVDKESVHKSKHFGKKSLYVVKSHLRKLVNNHKAKVVFVSTGR